MLERYRFAAQVGTAAACMETYVACVMGDTAVQIDKVTVEDTGAHTGVNTAVTVVRVLD